MHAYISRGASRVESAKYAVLGARDLIKKIDEPPEKLGPKKKPKELKLQHIDILKLISDYEDK